MKSIKGKISAAVLITAILSLVIFSSCGGPRKCNGSRGTRTEMGTM